MENGKNIVILNCTFKMILLLNKQLCKEISNYHRISGERWKLGHGFLKANFKHYCL